MIKDSRYLEKRIEIHDYYLVKTYNNGVYVRKLEELNQGNGSKKCLLCFNMYYYK